MVTYHHVSEDPRLWLFPQMASTINNSLVFHEFYNPMVMLLESIPVNKFTHCLHELIYHSLFILLQLGLLPPPVNCNGPNSGLVAAKSNGISLKFFCNM